MHRDTKINLHIYITTQAHIMCTTFNVLKFYLLLPTKLTGQWASDCQLRIRKPRLRFRPFQFCTFAKFSRTLEGIFQIQIETGKAQSEFSSFLDSKKILIEPLQICRTNQILSHPFQPLQICPCPEFGKFYNIFSPINEYHIKHSLLPLEICISVTANNLTPKTYWTLYTIFNIRHHLKLWDKDLTDIRQM